MQGFGGEARDALVGAWRRTRTQALFLLVLAYVAAPAHVADEAFAPADLGPQDLIAAAHPINAPAPTPEATPAPEARVATVARNEPPVPPAPAPTRPPVPPSGTRTVLASWYGPGFYGNRTACGQVFSETTWGIAHPSLPCGTVVSITYGTRTVKVPVLDRGPYIAGREVDLAEAVAKILGFTGVRPILLVIP